MFTLDSSARRVAVLAALTFFAAFPTGCSASAEETLDDESAEEAELSVRSARFETFVGIDDQVYFELIASNGKNMLRSEGYASLSNAKRGIQALIDNGQDESAYRVKQARNGEFYFNVVARNGETLSSSEMYATESSAERGAKSARTMVKKLSQPTPTPAPKKQRFELFRSTTGKTYFRLRAANGEVVLSSQAYTTKAAAQGGIESVRENGVVSERFDRIDGEDGQVRIRLVANNGAVIANGEPYASKSNAERAITRITEILSENVPTIEN